MKEVTRFTPPAVISQGVRGRYQLLEVLVARIMSLMQPEYEWTVTHVSQDHGMNFVGRHVLFDLPSLDLRSVETITGQYKRARKLQNPGRAVAWDIDRMVPSAGPSHIILAVAGLASPELRRKTVEKFTNAFHRPVTYLGIEEIDYLIRRYLSHLQPLIEQVLGERAAAVLTHFSSQPERTIPPEVQTRTPVIGETGKPFEIIVQVRSGSMPLDELRLRWEWPEYVGDEGPVTLFRLLTPLQAAQNDGMPFSPEERFAASVALKLVGYHPGSRDLGSLVLCSAAGAQVYRTPLGSIDLADRYHPPFFRAPFVPLLSEFEELWRQARAGHTHYIAVVGAGGAGKSRLCQEMGFQAEQDGGFYLFRSHPNHLERPYQIFGDLLRGLVPEPASLDDPGTVVLRHLRARNPALAERVTPTLNLLYRETSEAPAAATFDRAALVQSLCLLLLDVSRQQPLLVHISDCHWAQRGALDVFTEIRDRLAELPDARLRRILFVFEGRLRESLPSAGSSPQAVGTMAWETFVAQVPRPVLHVPTMDREQSAAFLRSLFESSQAGERRVPRQLIPLQDELIDEIRRCGEGNPFHLIEQLKLLRYRNVVACNRRTGLLYLAGPLQGRYEVPRSVRELIGLRLDYLRRRHPDAAVLLAACGLVRDRISFTLYHHLRERLAADVPETEVLASDFLQLPTHPLDEVSFRHENYYQVVRGIDLPAPDRDRIVRAWLEWLDRRSGESAQERFERALVLECAPIPDSEEIRALLSEALARADAEHQYILSRRVAEHLLPVLQASHRASGATDDLLEALRVERRLTNLLGLTGSWLERDHMLRTLIERLRRLLTLPPDPGNDRWRGEVEYMLFACMVSQANVWIDTLRHADAIHLMEDAVPRLYSRVGEVRRADAPAAADWIRLYVQGKNRMAVAAWFDGRHSVARPLLRAGFRESLALGDQVYTFHNLLDYATLCIHRDPRRASALLGECLAMLDRWKGAPPLPRHRYLTQFQRAIAELLWASRTGAGVRTRARELAEELQAIYLTATREGYVHEQGGTALVAGVCCAVGEEPEAVSWFMRAIRTAHASYLREFLWKAHLNLAQLCLELPSVSREGAGQHAEQAQRILESDLAQRVAPDDLRHRRALYLLPFAQLARIWDVLGDERAGGVRAGYPEVNGFFTPEGTLRPERHRRGQVLHATRGESDYFLLS
ncbi:MAG TPA: AAA family ATPase [Longimicrobium sp.]|nr:AAA family ATPase [Longimicrobium sp.]